ncbi:uncharacterized protein BT62DRAFT_1003606 [Guyanagaster necrorhizus]|uniref:Uncharacterized protein n=1 Tax=Guyanagaster necrorhizus TaxID=856835 RepID=A0A9P7VYE8_9AGAR|nr:uncharacterized protein BT62DRAFT_1003606 [Guyanagaster necrorhizus MCA 3950]KAG7448883.1 hypothetical protein BT62DRAFT_1003606 [Guyanagaster necrorhizus MCA 3950]
MICTDSNPYVPSSNDPPTTDAAQLDLLFRLRIIAQLQALAYPHIYHCHLDDHIIDILNWLASCFAPNASGDAVSVAFSAHSGLITLYIASNHNTPNTDAVRKCVIRFLSTLRTVLRDGDVGPKVASQMFFRMVVNIAHARIQRKIHLVGQTDEGPGQTAYHFTNLVSLWLVYRPEGEQSRGFLNMATNYGGNSACANKYLIESFLTLVNLPPEQADVNERYTYLSSIITACSLLVNSTFFDDLVNHHSFRLSLKIQDRIFLHKIFRRITRIAAYKIGAMQFAYFGLPFIRQVLGVSPQRAINVKLLSEPTTSHSLSKTYHWPYSPSDHIPRILPDSGSPQSTDESLSSEESHTLRSELSQLESQLRNELLKSELLVNVWEQGAPVDTKFHSELQLIHYLEENHVDVACQAFGTSKPVCWTCGCYIDHLQCTSTSVSENEESEEVGGGAAERRWWYSKGSRKVYYEWMIPPSAKQDTIDGLLEDSQRKMERIVEEVAFDCHF